MKVLICMFELMGKSSIHGGFTGINSWKIHNPWDFPRVNPCNLHQFPTLLQDFQGPQQDRPVEPVQNHPDDWEQNLLNNTPYLGYKNPGFPLRFCHASIQAGFRHIPLCENVVLQLNHVSMGTKPVSNKKGCNQLQTMEGISPKDPLKGLQQFEVGTHLIQNLKWLYKRVVVKQQFIQTA